MSASGVCCPRGSPRRKKGWPAAANLGDSDIKNFPFAERYKLQFRAEAFNLFNTRQFSFPSQNFDSPTAGKITSTIGDNRDMQMALRFNF